MFLNEAVAFSVRALRANPVRSLLTGLGMVIGTASVIWVVTISLLSRDYILEQIQGVGSNLIFAYYAAGGMSSTTADADFVKIADVQAVRRELGARIIAVTGVMTNYDRMLINNREEDVKVIGTDEAYPAVRNLVFSVGRFFDADDVARRQRVALLTDKLADRLFGTRNGAINQIIKIHGLQFTIIGTFHEKVETFGQSELEKDTILIPISVLQYFTKVERIDPMYVQVRRANEVDALAQSVKQILESRHRAGAVYHVDTLTGILNAAKSISIALTIVLILVAAIALIISGIGIMNIMLVTVTERTREIGVRMAVGASRREILTQFLAEAVLISLGGGVIGILAGVGLPLSVTLFVDEVKVPVSWVAVAVAFCVSCVVGLVFGMLPANRASKLNPTEALRYE